MPGPMPALKLSTAAPQRPFDAWPFLTHKATHSHPHPMATIKTINGTKEHKVVSPKAWLAARRKLLAEEKRFSRLRDQLAQKRRNLPWVQVEKDYTFDGPNGEET